MNRKKAANYDMMDHYLTFYMLWSSIFNDNNWIMFPFNYNSWFMSHLLLYRVIWRANPSFFKAFAANGAWNETLKRRNCDLDKALSTNLSTYASNTRIVLAQSQILFDKLTQVFFVLTKLWRSAYHHQSQKKGIANQHGHYSLLLDF